jgi:hypothetical protein
MRAFSHFAFIISVLLGTARAGHTLDKMQAKVLENWFKAHPGYRLATDAYCKCDEDIRNLRSGSGGGWRAVPDYHPYVATGDFNGDGKEDFAVLVLKKSAAGSSFALAVFNGPLAATNEKEAFFEENLPDSGQALFFGPPRPKPYRLVVGRFESDSGFRLEPHGKSYVMR